MQFHFSENKGIFTLQKLIITYGERVEADNLKLYLTSNEADNKSRTVKLGASMHNFQFKDTQVDNMQWSNIDKKAFDALTAFNLKNTCDANTHERLLLDIFGKGLNVNIEDTSITYKGATSRLNGKLQPDHYASRHQFKAIAANNAVFTLTSETDKDFAYQVIKTFNPNLQYSEFDHGLKQLAARPNVTVTDQTIKYSGKFENGKPQ